MYNVHTISLVKSVFGSEEGREVLQLLAKKCGAYTTSHVVGDPTQTAFNEGRRSVYTEITTLIGMSPEVLERLYHQDESTHQLQIILNQEKESYG